MYVFRRNLFPIESKMKLKSNHCDSQTGNKYASPRSQSIKQLNETSGHSQPTKKGQRG